MSRLLNVAAAQLGPIQREDNRAIVVKRLIDLRYPVYALADVLVQSRDVQHGQMVNDVIRALADWPGLKVNCDDF